MLFCDTSCLQRHWRQRATDAAPWAQTHTRTHTERSNNSIQITHQGHRGQEGTCGFSRFSVSIFSTCLSVRRKLMKVSHSLPKVTVMHQLTAILSPKKPACSTWKCWRIKSVLQNLQREMLRSWSEDNEAKMVKKQPKAGNVLVVLHHTTAFRSLSGQLQL